MEEGNFAFFFACLPSLLQGILCLLFLWPVLDATQQDSKTKQRQQYPAVLLESSRTTAEIRTEKMSVLQIEQVLGSQSFLLKTIMIGLPILHPVSQSNIQYIRSIMFL